MDFERAVYTINISKRSPIASVALSALHKIYNVKSLSIDLPAYVSRNMLSLVTGFAPDTLFTRPSINPITI